MSRWVSVCVCGNGSRENQWELDITLSVLLIFSFKPRWFFCGKKDGFIGACWIFYTVGIW